ALRRLSPPFPNPPPLSGRTGAPLPPPRDPSHRLPHHRPRAVCASRGTDLLAALPRTGAAAAAHGGRGAVRLLRLLPCLAVRRRPQRLLRLLAHQDGQRAPDHRPCYSIATSFC